MRTAPTSLDLYEMTLNAHAGERMINVGHAARVSSGMTVQRQRYTQTGYYKITMTGHPRPTWIGLRMMSSLNRLLCTAVFAGRWRGGTVKIVFSPCRTCVNVWYVSVSAIHTIFTEVL